ncbi:hypothetical protein [Prochlorococcus sp. MIT 0604]|uniref:hypothetical protein n=1 Tax=Prochlorococcus sp. MIT 0604 TaxID=1501268 RepID=UPI0004F757A0|nr:hypothetical protein [Prochlorococcus sp. MIT 0604]AIQ94725.1 hypothetical protein EW14_0705 [Prochlorococcus sp. MIT 0604]
MKVTNEESLQMYRGETCALKEIIWSYEQLLRLINEFYAYQMDRRTKRTKSHLEQIQYFEALIPKLKESLSEKTDPEYFLRYHK